VGITVIPVEASVGVTNAGAVGVVVVLTGLLLLFVHELNIKIESNERDIKIFMIYGP
jgi:hypothetical protein